MVFFNEKFKKARLDHPPPIYFILSMGTPKTHMKLYEKFWRTNN